jgi:hypothetical protein
MRLRAGAAGWFCEVRDMLAEVRAAEHPIMFTDKLGQPRIHPLVKHELILTNEYGNLFQLLGWDQAPPTGEGVGAARRSRA